MIVVDLDGTIADCSHRLHFIQQEDKDWDSFYAACGEDAPIRSVIKIVDMLEEFGGITFCTGRSDACRDITEAWLNKHGYYGCEVLMRKGRDYRPDYIVKPELLAKAGITPDKVSVIFEDRSAVVKAFRELGYTVAQVADGDF